MCEEETRGTSVDDASLEEVAEGCYAWIQPDGTWWINNAGAVLGEGEVLVVDTCTTAARTRRFLDAVATRSGESIVKLAVNTHHHGDHTYGNSLLPPETSIVGHEAMRAALEVDTMLDRFPGYWSPPPNLTDLRKRLPSLTIQNDMTAHLGGRRVDIVHPGFVAHTRGDLGVWVPDSKVLYVGDLLFPGHTPMILAGSATGAIRVLEWIEAFGAEHVVPGHGPVVTRSELPRVLAEHEAYYRFVIDVGGRAHASGVTPLAAAAAVDTTDFDHLCESERLVLNLHSVYAELEGRQIDRAAAFADLMKIHGGPVTTRV